MEKEMEKEKFIIYLKDIEGMIVVMNFMKWNI